MKEIIKIREETEMGYRLKKIEKMNDTQSCFFRRINKIHTLAARLQIPLTTV